MKRDALTLLSLLGLLVVVGCARLVWVKPGASQQEFGADNYACMQQSMATAPPIIAQEVVVNEAGNRNGNRAGAQVSPYDMNAATRDQLTSACLQARGWQLMTVENK